MTSRLSALISAHLITVAGAPLQLRLTYAPTDPLAVRAVILHAGTRLACWHFERQMLADGLVRPVGEGDVLFRPVDGADGRALRIELRGACPSGQGRAVLLADADAVAAFLRRTYAVVAAEEESAHLDGLLDALLSR
ncbi:SsgA family sporulation/cell division regulator [Streptomyces sp. NPDC012794]|uniref:SsgA family sporulation/cell division regulator n=1 Tax=Streptomyces sp. NPDC012794 TaxID=3364850 RepID=UPI0036B73567